MRKIRSGKSKKKKDGIVYSATYVPVMDPDSGQVRMYNVGWQMDAEQVQYQPLYQRAHRLMPTPKSTIFDPDEYLGELGPSIEVLKQAGEGADLKTDEILRAIGILGHIPVEEAIHALARFTEADHPLAKVGELAMNECRGFISIFKKIRKAC